MTLGIVLIVVSTAGTFAGLLLDAWFELTGRRTITQRVNTTLSITTTNNVQVATNGNL